MKNLLLGWLAAQGVALPNDVSDADLVKAVQKAAAKNNEQLTALENSKDTATGRAIALENELTTTKAALTAEQTARKAERKNSATLAVDLVIQKGKLAVAQRESAITALENSTDFAAELKKLEEAATVVKTADNSAAAKANAALENEETTIANEYKAAIHAEMKDGNISMTQAHTKVMTLPKYSGLAAKLAPKAGGK